MVTLGRTVSKAISLTDKVKQAMVTASDKRSRSISSDLLVCGVSFVLRSHIPF